MTPTPQDLKVTSARRVMAQHRRRRFPDTGWCGFCGRRWIASKTRRGTLTEGCAQRRQAQEVLDVAGQLDKRGRLRLRREGQR